MAGPRYSIKTVARMTGLSVHLIRMWEKRYQAVSPQRTRTNRRLYSDADIKRLNYLRMATAAGHAISNVASLPLQTLRSMIAKSAASVGRPRNKVVLPPSVAFQQSALRAVKEMDTAALSDALEKALVALGHQGLLTEVVSPLASTVGEHWRSGKFSAAHEHFLTAALKIFLGHLSSQFAARPDSPHLIVGTPAGQLHELGAVIVRDAAAQVGWNTTYLGPSLPAAEIAGAAIQNNVMAVALSIVYPDDDPNLPAELTALRRFLPKQVKILAGGRAAESYLATLANIGATVTDDIGEFCNELDRLRRSKRPKVR
jgi:DNA-binding transcriptional MerR regulator/methylmalonyl-CoA mutase cobalamin-binding subunit